MLLLKAAAALLMLLSGCATTILENDNEYSLHIHRPLHLLLVDGDGLAIGGYDTVAYFTQEDAVPGDPAIRESWNGGIWYFASEENRQRFLRDPEGYAPRYGAYCSWSVANNNYIPPAAGDPEAWMIIEDKLYFFFDKRVRSLWKLDRKDNLPKSVEQWPIKRDLMERYSVVNPPLREESGRS